MLIGDCPVFFNGDFLAGALLVCVGFAIVDLPDDDVLTGDWLTDSVFAKGWLRSSVSVTD